MNTSAAEQDQWPALDYARWRDTLATVHLWAQVVGKVRLAMTPWLNHGWHVPLYVGARGLGTSTMHQGWRMLEIDFDFVDHKLTVRTSDGLIRGFLLEPMSVAAFYRRLMGELAAAGIDITINVVPNEVPAPVPFPLDEAHASYDRASVHGFWRALAQVDRVFRLFRTRFLGKCSPVHFFWGSFDLAVTRFSGRKAPLHPGGVPGLPDDVTREAYSHEVSSAGFWPGSDVHPHAAFYSYAYPTPEGYATAEVGPAGAIWSAQLGEWLLPYDEVKDAPHPDVALLTFLESTYRAAAQRAQWDPALECATGVPGTPRHVSP